MNSCHKNIKFPIEIETENKMSFLDVLLIRNNSLISTKVYRWNKNTDIYINWKWFAPNDWKWGTLKTLVTRAFDIFSTDECLKEDTEFTGNNGCNLLKSMKRCVSKLLPEHRNLEIILKGKKLHLHVFQ